MADIAMAAAVVRKISKALRNAKLKIRSYENWAVKNYVHNKIRALKT